MNTLYSFRRCPYAMRARMALRWDSLSRAERSRKLVEL